MKKLTYQGHITMEQQCYDLNPGLIDSKGCVFAKAL